MQTRTTLALAMLVIPVGLVMADTPLSNPDALPKVSCNDIHYSPAVLQHYPKAPAACLEGRVVNGENWGKFNARVSDTHLPDSITLEMLNVAGTPISTLSFKPPAGEKIDVSGRSTQLSELHAGDVITLWIPQTRLEARALPSPTASTWHLLPSQAKK